MLHGDMRVAQGMKKMKDGLRGHCSNELVEARGPDRDKDCAGCGGHGGMKDGKQSLMDG